MTIFIFEVYHLFRMLLIKFYVWLQCLLGKWRLMPKNDKIKHGSRSNMLKYLSATEWQFYILDWWMLLKFFCKSKQITNVCSSLFFNLRILWTENFFTSSMTWTNSYSKWKYLINNISKINENEFALNWNIRMWRNWNIGCRWRMNCIIIISNACSMI